jgi:hypothetical protein
MTFEGIFDNHNHNIVERSVYYIELVKARDDLEDLLVAAENIDDKVNTLPSIGPCTSPWSFRGCCWRA